MRFARKLREIHDVHLDCVSLLQMTRNTCKQTPNTTNPPIRRFASLYPSLVSCFPSLASFPCSTFLCVLLFESSLFACTAKIQERQRENRLRKIDPTQDEKNNQLYPPPFQHEHRTHRTVRHHGTTSRHGTIRTGTGTRQKHNDDDTHPDSHTPCTPSEEQPAASCCILLRCGVVYPFLLRCFPFFLTFSFPFSLSFARAWPAIACPRRSHPSRRTSEHKKRHIKAGRRKQHEKTSGRRLGRYFFGGSTMTLAGDSWQSQ